MRSSQWLNVSGLHSSYSLDWFGISDDDRTSEGSHLEYVHLSLAAEESIKIAFITNQGKGKKVSSFSETMIISADVGQENQITDDTSPDPAQQSVSRECIWRELYQRRKK